jgi:hypothetical protein
MPIKTFRGLLADGDQQTINLKHRDGRVGYRIVKLELFPYKPGHSVNYESVVQIFTKKQTTVPASGATVNFGDTTLLGAAYYQDNNNDAYPASLDVVFDNVVFNQDIFVTLTDNSGGAFINYHIELEQMRIDSDEAAVATLKNMRAIATQTVG